MAFFTQDHPLGLPQGSVRAIAFITLTYFLGALLYKGMIIPTVLIGFYGTMMGFYFGQKTVK